MTTKSFTFLAVIAFGICCIQCKDPFSDCRKSRKINITCDPRAVFRTFDGSCNNLLNKEWGTINTSLMRHLVAQYEEDDGTPRGFGTESEIPSANQVSRELFTVEHGNKEMKDGLSTLFMTFGQFLDHDISLTPHEKCKVKNCSSDEAFKYPCFPVMFSSDDDKCTPFARSIPVCRTSVEDGRDQVNTITSFVDGSQIYGSSKKDIKKLKEEDSPMLKLNNTLMPLNLNMKDCKTIGGCSLVGDVRGDENIALHSLHTIFVREHNRIVGELFRMHPNWDIERLFHTARKINIGQLQHIVYSEWLRELVDLTPYEGYNSKVNPSIANVFSTVAFRFGHSMIPNSFSQLDKGFNKKFEPINLRQAFFNRTEINSNGIEPTMFGQIANGSTPSDTGFAFSISRRLFVKLKKNDYKDLAALNIQRGRDHGIPTYGKWRDFCGLEKIENTYQVDRIMRRGVKESLERLGQDVDDLDLFAAGMAEVPYRDGDGRRVVGETFHCIIKDQFERLRDGDRFYYEAEGVFDDDELNAIKQASMSRILCDNLKGIVSVQKNSFINSKKRIECGGVNSVNLAVFK